MIPKKIFQTWKTKNVSKELKDIIDTWKKNNIDFEYYFYDDKDCEDFLKSFNNRVFKVYKKIAPGAFKADLWRVCILYKFGGFYCDVDTLCLGKINHFVDDNIEFIAPVDLNLNCSTGHNLFNSFIGATPNSKIMKYCIDRIIYNVENNITDISALDFSSCGVLGRATNVFLNLKETTSFIGKEGVHNNIHLLKFEEDKEYVKDIKGNVLFQNKNGNQEVKSVYEKECKNCGITSWFDSKNWIMRKKFL